MKRGLWVAGVVWIGGAGLFLACSSGDDASSAAPDAAVTSDGATDASVKADVAAGDSSPQDSSPGDACTASPCVTQVAGGFLFECAVSTDRTVRCWGSNVQGALGHDTDGAPDDPVPTPVVGLSNVVQVAAGFSPARRPRPTRSTAGERRRTDSSGRTRSTRARFPRRRSR